MVLGIVQVMALILALGLRLDLDGELPERGVSSFLEDTILKLVGMGGVDAPEASLAWLVLLARNLLEALVE